MRAAAISILFAVLAVSTGCVDKECLDHCSDRRQLVCGTDDLTYDNSCVAACAGEDVQYAGPCTEELDSTGQQD